MNVVLFFLIVSMFFTACTPQVVTTPVATSIPDQPVTLHFAIADAEGRASDPYVHEFIDQVKTLSNGNIIIEPTWDAGAETTPVFEQGVVKIVKDGQYDLGLAGSRAWDSLGVTSFEALQAPFLISDDALAEAVASSDIAKRMFDGLSSANVTGLALWPEDLRHPFSVVPGEPILSPHDFEGKTVRVVPSEVSNLLIKTLGGNPMFGNDYQRAESGLRQGFSLTGMPIATGNVVFFPKFQVLFANGAAFAKLSKGQQAILHRAAEATQKKAIEEHLSEVDAATAWCTDGGTVVMASQEQVKEFEAAAKPVFDKIEQDPHSAEFISAIRELKTKTTPSAGAQACAPVVQASPMPATESQEWSQGEIPNGVWQANLTSDDFVQFGVRRSVAQSDWAGPYTLTFKDGKYTMDWQSPQGKHYSCEAKYQSVEDFVRLTYLTNECDGGIDDIQWRIDDQGLHLHLIATKGHFSEVKAFFEAEPWQKIADS